MRGLQISLLTAGALMVAACSGDDTSSSESDSATTSATTLGSASATTTQTGSASDSSSATDSSGSMSASDSSSGSTTASSESDSSASASATDATTTDATTMGVTEGSTTGGSVCGDGVVEGAEECDDANDDDSDDCLSTCVAATCGDGFVHAGVEACDDGNAVDKDSCSNACTKVPCEEQEGMGGNEFLSYIWIANSGQNTVSKINTETAVEEARYYVEGGSPSRTSVNLRGDVAVSSRDPGGITKIAARVEDCVDLNNNGMIETSSGPNDILPLGTDECVLWRKPVPSPGYSYGPRATAWVAGTPDPDTCEYPEPLLWVGWKDNSNTAHFLKIDGATGDTIDEILHPWGPSYSPYGGAVDKDGNFYATGLNTMPSVKIDFETLEVTDLGNPTGCKYGMTLDTNGFVWNGACFGEGVHYRDPNSNTWTTLPDSGGTRVNGIMADADGNVWGAGSNPCRLVHIDAETKTYVNKNIPLPGCTNPWGVSIDFQGYVWVVDMSANKAFKVDPDTYEVVAEVTGLQNPYTYSDMTGIALAQQVKPQ
ncbi:MAG: DUF4215 domain-containing protein [Nannocystaceae bacterium]